MRPFSITLFLNILPKSLNKRQEGMTAKSTGFNLARVKVMSVCVCTATARQNLTPWKLLIL